MLAVIELMANYGYCWNVGQTNFDISNVIGILDGRTDVETRGKTKISVIGLAVCGQEIGTLVILLFIHSLCVLHVLLNSTLRL